MLVRMFMPWAWVWVRLRRKVRLTPNRVSRAWFTAKFLTQPHSTSAVYDWMADHSGPL